MRTLPNHLTKPIPFNYRAGIHKETATIHQQQKMAINSAAFYQSPSDGQWFIFAGLKNGAIDVHRGASEQPITTLREHSSNVCVLHVDTTHRLLISGSWDSKALVWSIDEILGGGEVQARELLPKHTHSVWAIATLPSSDGEGQVCRILTGSADKTIKLHDGRTGEARTFAGHKDVVRSLIALSPRHFISAANDSTVRVWDVESGSCLQMVGHMTGFIKRIDQHPYAHFQVESAGGEYLYTMCRLSNNYLVSAGEGGYFDIWRLHWSTEGKEGEGQTQIPSLLIHQNLRLPVSSIWSVSEPRSGDIAMAANTGQVYIFSSNKGRWAGEELLQSFDAEFTAVLAKEIQNQLNDVGYWRAMALSGN